jgi:hypothetical protein
MTPRSKESPSQSEIVASAYKRYVEAFEGINGKSPTEAQAKEAHHRVMVVETTKLDPYMLGYLFDTEARELRASLPATVRKSLADGTAPLLELVEALPAMVNVAIERGVDHLHDMVDVKAIETSAQKAEATRLALESIGSKHEKTMKGFTKTVGLLERLSLVVTSVVFIVLIAVSCVSFHLGMRYDAATSSTAQVASARAQTKACEAYDSAYQYAKHSNQIELAKQLHALHDTDCT